MGNGRIEWRSAASLSGDRTLSQSGSAVCSDACPLPGRALRSNVPRGVFDGLGAVKAIESVFTERLNLSPLMILILMQLSFILMGTFLDDTAMLVIVAPLYVPLVGALGFDLIWYGILYTITTQIAYMTPPFGYNLFLMRAMAPPEISLKDIYASITPFVLIMVCALILIMIFPSIATWLPDYVYNQP